MVDPILARIAPQKKAGKMNVFKIESTPDGADVEIDGLFEGNTPMETELEAGVHTLIISMPGYEVWDKKVRVTSRTKMVKARLREKTTTDTNVNVNVNPF